MLDFFKGNTKEKQEETVSNIEDSEAKGSPVAKKTSAVTKKTPAPTKTPAVTKASRAAKGEDSKVVEEKEPEESVSMDQGSTREGTPSPVLVPPEFQGRVLVLGKETPPPPTTTTDNPPTKETPPTNESTPKASESKVETATTQSYDIFSIFTKTKKEEKPEAVEKEDKTKEDLNGSKTEAVESGLQPPSSIFGAFTPTRTKEVKPMVEEADAAKSESAENPFQSIFNVFTTTAKKEEKPDVTTIISNDGLKVVESGSKAGSVDKSSTMIEDTTSPKAEETAGTNLESEQSPKKDLLDNVFERIETFAKERSGQLQNFAKCDGSEQFQYIPKCDGKEQFQCDGGEKFQNLTKCSGGGGEEPKPKPEAAEGEGEGGFSMFNIFNMKQEKAKDEGTPPEKEDSPPEKEGTPPTKEGVMENQEILKEDKLTVEETPKKEETKKATPTTSAEKDKVDPDIPKTIVAQVYHQPRKRSKSPGKRSKSRSKSPVKLIELKGKSRSRSPRRKRSKSPVKIIKERSRSRSKSPSKKGNTKVAKEQAEAEEIQVPDGLARTLEIFENNDVKEFLMSLCSNKIGQAHLFDKWEKSDKISPAVLRQMGNQLYAFDKTYPGGLREYILKAKKMLKDSKDGVNPFEDYTPSVPLKFSPFQLGSTEYKATEKVGIKQLGSVGFVLVAGGLGERLGYTSGAKVGLPTETTTGTTYLQYYCEYIKAVQNKCAKGTTKLPLCIMVSNDTKWHTIKLLKDNKYFGLRKRQIFMVEQGEGVPALSDNDAKIALDPNDPFKILMKPHGHGDIHSLLYKEGITRIWKERYGLKYLVIFQDTNALPFYTLPLMLGVSEKKGYIMNSLAVPRKAKQAINSIVTLKSKKGIHRTMNVEYNHIDSLLRNSKYFKEGDVNDKSGFSPFPGNTNQLLFKLDKYHEILQRTKGVMPDFVNPKYTDDSKTAFKKPARLECMMADFPTVLDKAESKLVGFTAVDASLCFSPVKNTIEDGIALQSKGIPAATAINGEADQYAATRMMLRSRGCKIEDAPPVKYGGIKVIPGPAIVLKPDFVCCPGEYNIKFPYPEKVKISAASTLVVRGPGVTIESLDLDGTLIIDVDRTEKAIVRDLVVRNDGWVQVADLDGTEDEKIAMRGFKIIRGDARYIEVKSKDAIVEDEVSDGGTEYLVEDRIACGGLELGPSMDEDEDIVAVRGAKRKPGCAIM